MKHALMKTFGPYLGLLFVALAIVSLALAPVSCKSTAEQRAVVIALAQLGATYAESSGHLPPGSAVTISQGVAILASDESTEVKLMRLKDTAISEALARGDLKEGDKLIVDQTGTALVKIISAVEASRSNAPPSNPLLPPAAP